MTDPLEVLEQLEALEAIEREHDADVQQIRNAILGVVQVAATPLGDLPGILTMLGYPAQAKHTTQAFREAITSLVYSGSVRMTDDRLIAPRIREVSS